jgi:23S rRNA pseudouridine2605 synthase
MCGIASRRKADDLIREGKVEVNGEIPTDPGFTIDPDRDRVAVNGRQIVRTHEPLYLVLNKPKDAITTLKDERGRPTVMEHINARRRVYPVGRLDRNTTGVLLFTDDGEFANRLMHPRYHVPKTYVVSCSGTVTREHLRALAEGVPLPDGTTAPAEIGVVGGSKASRIVITIREGRNRQVRRMFEHLGYEVTKLDRVGYGPVTVDDLPRGASRSLTPQEIRMLRRMAGFEMRGEEETAPAAPEVGRVDGASARRSERKPGPAGHGERRHAAPHGGRKPGPAGHGERRHSAPPGGRKPGPAGYGERRHSAPPGGRKHGPAGYGERRHSAPPGGRKPGPAGYGERRHSAPPGGRKPGPAGHGERRHSSPPRPRTQRTSPTRPGRQRR